MTTVLDRHSRSFLIDPSELDGLRETSVEARLEGPNGPLPLVEVSAKTTIDGLVATTVYTQRFTNPTTDHLEASYIFPLPSRAGVTGFFATLGGRRIEGLLKERGEARANYAQAMAESKRAAIIESERSDVFTAKVGNIAPGEGAVIELTVTGLIAVEDGEATFRFPLVCAPRYISGEVLGEERAGLGQSADTDAVPDASRLNPPLLGESQDRPIINFSINILYPGLAAAAVRTSHPMSVAERGRSEGSAVELVLARGARMDSDLLVRFSLPSEFTMQATFLDDPVTGEGGTEDGVKTGTWAVSVVSPRRDSATPRDIVVVVDRSGSMDGWKMVVARRAAARLIDTLSPEDRFGVVAFDSGMRVFHPNSSDSGNLSGSIEMVSGTDRNRFAAVSWLVGMKANGGTEMLRPVAGAVASLAGSAADREPVLVLITDGQIGAESQLLANLEANVGRTRFCVVGIDKAPNTSLLERLARRTNGYVTFVESEDQLDAALVNLARRVGGPELLSVQVSIDGGELLAGDTAPGRPIDVFSGVPGLITGRWRHSGDRPPVLSIRGDRSDGSGVFSEAAVAVKSTSKGIGDMWARMRIADLEDRYDAAAGDRRGARSAERDALRAAIIKLSVSSRVLSHLTAFVAVDSETQEIASSQEIPQPVESPDGWTLSGASLGAGGANTAILRGFTHTSGLVASAGPVGSGGQRRINSYLSPQTTVDRIFDNLSNPFLKEPLVDPFGAVVLALLKEALERLKLANDNNPARVGDIVQRLQERLYNGQHVEEAVKALSGYTNGTVALGKATRAVEDAIRVLGPTGPTLIEKTERKYRDGAGTREFWS